MSNLAPKEVQEISAALNNLRTILQEESTTTSLEKVKKPSIVEDVLSFDFSHIDALSTADMEKYLGALSQYYLYISKYINQTTVAANAVQRRYDFALNQKILQVKKSGQTVKEKTIEAESDTTIIELGDMLERFQARVSMYKNMPDAIELMIQTIKKVYDARIKERESYSAQ